MPALAPLADVALACDQRGMGDYSTVIEASEGGEGLKRWRLLRRPHGLYLYEEWTWQTEICLMDEDGNEGTVVAEGYWEPTHVSGLFDTSMAARENAISALPWLRSALSADKRSGS
jgi:hypothetical protein